MLPYFNLSRNRASRMAKSDWRNKSKYVHIQFMRTMVIDWVSLLNWHFLKEWFETAIREID